MDTPFPDEQPIRERHSPSATLYQSQNYTPCPHPTMVNPDRKHNQHKANKTAGQGKGFRTKNGGIIHKYLDFLCQRLPPPGYWKGGCSFTNKHAREKSAYIREDSLITNFETELMALYLFQQLLVEHINNYGPPPAIAIFSDSQAALKSVTLLKRKSPGQQLATQIFNNLQNWASHLTTRLYWCPGHIGIQHNEEVNKLAKEAANSRTPPPYMLYSN
ncbi:hypothetical protein O181_019661 [Austropuccinia psidii MF-1]|uniref:RNase H type-1 domain-containing protein n=1 Tax=Austropuccinia psidii MF-1 TaxID=1389203 RepID=A0A9Q3CC01_9BASI|nr:hypothetical protein [Austropuccinia psidii MF-1]